MNCAQKGWTHLTAFLAAFLGAARAIMVTSVLLRTASAALCAGATVKALQLATSSAKTRASGDMMQGRRNGIVCGATPKLWGTTDASVPRGGRSPWRLPAAVIHDPR